MKCDLEGIFEVMKKAQKDRDIEKILKTALSFKFSRKKLNQYINEYKNNPNKEFKAICDMY
jgi:preprotein translocase subunit Sec63